MRVAPPGRGGASELRYLVAFVRLAWAHQGRLVALVVALRIARGGVPLAALWVGKLILDGVVAARATGAGWRPLVGLVAAEIAIVAGGELLARAAAVGESALADALGADVGELLMTHAAALDLATVEDPQLADHLERARRHANGRTALMGHMLAALDSTVTLATLASALVTFSPWLLLLLLGTSVPGLVGETRFAGLQYALQRRWTQQRRELDYLQIIGASTQTAKEVKAFALAPWLVRRYRRLAAQWRADNLQLAVRRALVSANFALLGTLGYYAAYGVIIVRTVGNALTIGELGFFAAAFGRARDLVRGLLGALSGIYDESLYMRDLFVFLERRPTVTSRPAARPVPKRWRRGIEFDGVGFRYPESERWAVRHVSFTLRTGERLALVGENGAGKTTLTKLAIRLYDPTEGRVLLDGVDFREYDLDALRRAIGVVFQDFVRYDMCFDENVGAGDIEATSDYLDGLRWPTDRAGGRRAEVTAMASLRAAAEHSFAASLLPRLPNGWRQMLGRRFDGGVELSGGEWQRVALARAHLRDAQLLILDEPTAALDARAEYEVYRRFAELTAGRSAMIISHRFASVRMAEHIVVLRAGEIVQDGNHDELVRRAGLYSELFELQAAGYR